MSSSGLIYAVIVGAWAAYLVPMWLRRQDELNEARPTERFSTAIRLLSGKAAMERRYEKDAERREAVVPDGRPDAPGGRAAGPGVAPGDDDAGGNGPDAAGDAVDVRAFADPRTDVRAPAGRGAEARDMSGGAGDVGSQFPTELLPSPGLVEATAGQGRTGRRRGRKVRAAEPARAGVSAPLDGSGERRDGSGPAEQAEGEDGQHVRHEGPRRPARVNKRAKVLARRRRTTMVLFLVFTAGAVVAGVGGVPFLWAPAVPAVLLSAYIVHLRIQERRRFAVTMDRRRAEAAAQRLWERQRRGAVAGRDGAPGAGGPAETDGDAAAADLLAAAETEFIGRAAGGPAGRGEGVDAAAAARGGRPRRPVGGGADEAPGAADRRALVEETDHAEWVDQQRARERDGAEGEGWEPVPVPLPTYVSAPVAPRTARGVDLEAPDAWSSARSSTVARDGRGAGEGPRGADPSAPRPRNPREHGRTPLFDQFDQRGRDGRPDGYDEDGERPRAANE